MTDSMRQKLNDSKDIEQSADQAPHDKLLLGAPLEVVKETTEMDEEDQLEKAVV